MIRAVVAAAVLVAACGAPASSSSAPPQQLTVFAAASLQPAFERIASRLGDEKITFNYAGTQTLTSQITQGAQADVFASADMAHMRMVQNAGLVSDRPKVFAHNRLAIAVQRGNPKAIHSLADLARPGVVVVLADPSVPAGKYAQQSLDKAKVTVHPVSLELQVTGVLSKVALGEADAGIVYVSDVVTSGKVDGVQIPDELNVIADYPVAKLKATADAKGADEFISYLLSSNGQAILVAAGFEKP